MTKKRALTVAVPITIAWFSIIAGISILTASAGYAEKAGPCADDAAKFCKDAQKSKGGISKCLKEHVDELSPACKEKLGETKEKIKDFAEACETDLSRFCQEVKPGGGRIIKCLKKHESELSPECKAKMGSGK